MKTVTLKNNAIHTGNLILVNAHHPYLDDPASRRWQNGDYNEHI